MRQTIGVVVGTLLTCLVAGAAVACPGDCNGDGTITVDELVRGVSVALGDTSARCSTLDQNDDDEVTVDELTTAINTALSVCPAPPAVEFATFNIPSAATPADTPGSAGVAITNPKLLAQLGADADLNQARYTRFRFDDAAKPDAILILVPGFEGGANTSRSSPRTCSCARAATTN